MAMLRDELSVVFLIVFCCMSAFTYWRLRFVRMEFSGGLAALGVCWALIRSIPKMRADVANHKAAMEAEVQRRAEWEREFGLACVNVARIMSNLSGADLSVFITADRFLGQQGNSYRFLTAQGSPVHHVLVAMADVGATRPVEMKRIAPGQDYSLATYELTEFGEKVLAQFISDALEFRRNQTQ